MSEEKGTSNGLLPKDGIDCFKKKQIKCKYYGSSLALKSNYYSRDWRIMASMRLSTYVIIKLLPVGH